MIGYLEKELRKLGNVHKVHLWSWVRLISVEVVVETLWCGSKARAPGRCCLGCDNGRGASNLLAKVALKFCLTGLEKTYTVVVEAPGAAGVWVVVTVVVVVALEHPEGVGAVKYEVEKLVVVCGATPSHSQSTMNS